MSVLTGTCLEVHAAPEPEVYLAHDWYLTEVVIFAKAGVREEPHYSGPEHENVVLSAPRSYPRALVPFRMSDEESVAHLTPATRNQLEWWADAVPVEALVELPDWLLEPDPLAQPFADTLTRPSDEAEIGPVDAALDTVDGGLGPDGEPLSARTPIVEPLTPVEVVEQEFLAYETRLDEESFQWQSKQMALTAAARRLVRGGFEIVHHGRWTQPVPARDAAAPVLLQVGRRHMDGLFDVEGTLSVTKGRYLHFHARMWLAMPEPMALETSVDPDPTGRFEAFTSAPVEDTVRNGLRYIELDESRRMRSSEVHYLDHPLMGILVVIEPLEIPDELVALVEALDSPGENF